MKNILVITPFYPYTQYDHLIHDTNAIYYLCKNKRQNENIIIVYYYQHTRFEAYKALPKILGIRDYKECLHKDDSGNDILLFEHPGMVPSRYRTFKFIDNK